MNRRKIKYQILGLLLVAAILIWLAVFSQPRAGLLEVDFFDVGQGDAIFIETPKGYQVLIDGGPDASVLEKLGQEMPFYDRSIDLIILTHPEADHITGLIEVLKNYQIGQILENGFKRETAGYKEWQRLIKEKNIPVKITQAGQVVNLSQGIKIRILWPDKTAVNSSPESSNNISVVSQLIYGQREFLFTGDIEKQVELNLAVAGIDLESDVLKAAHHGSKTSTNQLFLEKVNPNIAVISAGDKNPYGHPHQEVLERLKNVKTYRTDQNGNIEILTNGQWFKAATER